MQGETMDLNRICRRLRASENNGLLSTMGDKIFLNISHRIYAQRAAESCF